MNTPQTPVRRIRIQPGPDRRLLSLCAQAVTLWRVNDEATQAADFMERTPEAKAHWAAIHARSARWHALCDKIRTTPARTMAGMRGKAEVLACAVALEEPMIASLVSDILGRRVSGEAECGA